MVTDYFGFELKVGDCVIFTQDQPQGLVKGNILEIRDQNRPLKIGLIKVYDEFTVDSTHYQHPSSVIKHDTVVSALKDVYAENFV